MSEKMHGLYGFTVERSYPDRYDCYGWLTPNYVDEPGNLQGTRVYIYITEAVISHLQIETIDHNKVTKKLEVADNYIPLEEIEYLLKRYLPIYEEMEKHEVHYLHYNAMAAKKGPYGVQVYSFLSTQLRIGGFFIEFHPAGKSTLNKWTVYDGGNGLPVQIKKKVATFNRLITLSDLWKIVDKYVPQKTPEQDEPQRKSGGRKL